MRNKTWTPVGQRLQTDLLNNEPI